MREATAQNTRHSFLDFLFRRLRVFIQKSLGGHDDAIQAKPALRGLLFYERSLDGVRLVDGAQTFKCDDLDSLHRFYRRDAGANRLTLHKHSARSALSQPATEFRAAQAEVVGQDVK